MHFSGPISLCSEISYLHYSKITILVTSTFLLNYQHWYQTAKHSVPIRCNKINLMSHPGLKLRASQRPGDNQKKIGLGQCPTDLGSDLGVRTVD